MTHAELPPGERVTDPFLAAAFDDGKPYTAAVYAVGLLGAPAELVVAVVRRLRGRPGVSLGPGWMNLANELVALGVVRFFRRRPALRQRLSHSRIVRWSVIPLTVYLVLSPAAAAGWQQAEVLRGRSPLWGGLVPLSGLLHIMLLALAFIRARRARLSGKTGAGEDAVARDGESSSQ